MNRHANKVFPLVLLILVTTVMALSYTPGTAQTDLSEAQIREYTEEVLVPESNDPNAALVPRTVHHVEADRFEVVEIEVAGEGLSEGTASLVSGGGVNFTLSGRTSNYQIDACNFQGWVGGRTGTSSGTCVDATYVKAQTKITGPSGTYWGPTAQNTNGWPGCNDDTNWHDTSQTTIAEGSNLIAHNDHKGQVSGVWYEWLGLEEASDQLTDPTCPF